ncbi:Fe(3+)-hydroxamate ABC transporter permease FhuB [Pseudorhizobium endolithicum]|uniref:Fe(3+)-hydroxamate ABC transporter permease FhuB n=2 Tax=Pseudorhizobium endolithicum TaxID=1191678 RepID=A0ABN7JDD5_9HYPH|nr:Fe(3+)-hydroxamate ABC transporter permease FhuB [Pseudorhizobium endolithicum]
MHGMAEIARPRPLERRGLAFAATGIGCLALLLMTVWMMPAVPGPAEQAERLRSILLWQSLMPRALLAVLAGAALGLSGALLQHVLRNPIADASTLGIASGAQLALTVALALWPALLVLPREMIAFSGGFLSLAVVLGLSWRRQLDPVTVALSGMIVTMIASALSVAIILARGEYVMSIFIWGSGSLSQQDWSGVLSLVPRLIFGVIATVLLMRPLRVMSLDDSAARSLGVAIHATRLAVLALAVWLAASVTAIVGVIGFLGLAAPAIARYRGARTTGEIAFGAAIAGGLLLFSADSLMQILGPGFSDLAPAGAATALFGGPLLLLLLPRVRSTLGLKTATAVPLRRLRRPETGLALLAVGLILLFALTLTLGVSDDGLVMSAGPAFTELLPFRLPRLLAAGGAGAMLAAAGLVMQRITGNPLASPEVLGVSAGAGAGLTVALFVVAFPSLPVMLGSMAGGALLTFLMMMALMARSGFSAERVLLAGVAAGALGMALVSLVLAQGDMRSYILLLWISGSTNRVGAMEAAITIGALVLLTAPLFFLGRWLALLPLGPDVARSVGLPVAGTRLLLALLAALLTAAGSFVAGPLSLTGLVAPHLARMSGFRRPGHQLAAALMIGAGLLVAADWLSRLVIYPYQIPLGLFSALISGPYLLWLLGRKSDG